MIYMKFLDWVAIIVSLALGIVFGLALNYFLTALNSVDDYNADVIFISCYAMLISYIIGSGVFSSVVSKVRVRRDLAEYRTQQAFDKLSDNQE